MTLEGFATRIFLVFFGTFIFLSPHPSYGITNLYSEAETGMDESHHPEDLMDQEVDQEMGMEMGMDNEAVFPPAHEMEEDIGPNQDYYGTENDDAMNTADEYDHPMASDPELEEEYDNGDFPASLDDTEPELEYNRAD